jgi:hypothetical protein
MFHEFELREVRYRIEEGQKFVETLLGRLIRRPLLTAVIITDQMLGLNDEVRLMHEADKYIALYKERYFPDQAIEKQYIFRNAAEDAAQERSKMFWEVPAWLLAQNTQQNETS